MWTFTKITDHSLELQKSNFLENMGNVFAVVMICTPKMNHAPIRELHATIVDCWVIYLLFVQENEWPDPKSSIQSTSIQLQLNSTGYPFNLSMLSTLNSILIHVSSITQKLKKLIVQTWEPRALEISKNTYQLQFLKSTCTSTKTTTQQLSKSANCSPQGEL